MEAHFQDARTRLQERLVRDTSPNIDEALTELRIGAKSSISQGKNPLLAEMESIASAYGDDVPGTVMLRCCMEPYGFAVLDDKALSAIVEVARGLDGKVYGIGSGRGYCEALLAHAGLDVVGSDRKSYEDRFYDRIVEADVSSAAEHPDRMLFCGYPDKLFDDSRVSIFVSAMKKYVSAGGRAIAIVGPSDGRHPYGGCGQLDEFEADIRDARVYFGDTAPRLRSESIMMMRTGHWYYEQQARVYDLRQLSDAKISRALERTPKTKPI